MKSLSIIIPNFNGEDLLNKFLPNIIDTAKEYRGKWEIIVVDDFSTDNSKAVLNRFERLYPFLKVLRNAANLGFSRTCNAGMQAAAGEVLFFLNNDVTLDKGFFNYFDDYFKNPDTFAVTVKAFRMDDASFLDGAKPASWKRGMPRVTNNITSEDFKSKGMQAPYASFAVQGAYFFAHAAKMRLLGGFDELFSPYIYEETDLSYRALKRGWKIYYEPRCIAHHAISSSIGKKKKSRTKVIAAKNRIIFVWKNIHSGKLLFTHFVFLALRLLIINLTYWKALIMALKVLKEIRKKRRQEQQEAVVTDMALFRQYDMRHGQWEKSVQTIS